MSEGKVLYEEQAIREVLGQALRLGTLLDIVLSGEDQHYATRVLANTDGLPFVEDGLLITPLEPTAGNIKIRRANGVQMGFHIDEMYYECKSSFVRAHAMDNGQALVLSTPRVLRGMVRRHQPRTHVPPDVELIVQIEQRGENVLQGKLNDISPAGLSFSCDAMAAPIEKGERVKLTLRGRDLGSNTITMPATVAFHARARKAEDIQSVADKYGLQFGAVSAVQSMQIDRLIKFLEKKSSR